MRSKYSRMLCCWPHRPISGRFGLLLVLACAAANAAEIPIGVVSVEGEEKRDALIDSDTGLKFKASSTALKDVAEIVLGEAGKPSEGSAIYLRNGDILRGLKILSGDDSKLSFKSEGCGELTLENKFVHALTFPTKERLDPDVIEGFLKAPKSKEDSLLLPKGDTTSGYLEKFTSKDLSFNAGGQSRAYAFEQIAGLRLAPLEEFKPRTDLVASISLRDGSRITGKILALKSGALSVEGINQQPWRIPAESIATIEFKGGKMVYLSQLNPSAAEERPYAGGAPVVFHWRKDKSAIGETLKIAGREFPRGLGVHSYSKLTFSLEKQYDKFLCVVGLDAAAGSSATCTWKVLVDGKESAAGIAKAGAKAEEIKIVVKGATLLELVCDYGPDEDDAGDQLDWAGARLIKP